MAQDEECDYKELSVRRKLLFASSLIVAMLAMGGVAYFTFANIGEVYSYRVGYDHVAISVLYPLFYIYLGLFMGTATNCKCKK